MDREMERVRESTEEAREREERSKALPKQVIVQVGCKTAFSERLPKPQPKSRLREKEQAGLRHFTGCDSHSRSFEL